MKLQEQKEEELEACEAMLTDDVLMRANVTSTHDKMITAQSALNVHTLCRICAEAGEHMEEIFGAAQLHTKINLCLPIKVCESDSLSLSVCHSCVARLENSFELATQSQRSDVILRDLQQRQNEEQRQIQVQQQNEEQKYQSCDPIEHKVAVSQISAVNSPVSNMDLSQTSHHNSPPNSTKNNAVKNYNLKPLSVQLTRLSQKFIDTFTVKVEQYVSESSQEQMRNDDTNLQDIKLEPQFSNTNENDWIEENHRAAGCDVRIKTEVDESCSNLHHVAIDNEIFHDEDPLQNEITSELIIKSEHEWSDVEECRDNVHDVEGHSSRVKEKHLKGAKNSESLKIEQHNKGLKIEHRKKKHEVRLTNLNINKCTQCDKTFSTKSNLIQHKKLVHEAVRSFHCSVCQKSFKSKNVLKDHLRVHSDVRLFKCDKCYKRFKSRSEVNMHNKNVHSDARPFQCKKCGKAFKSKSNFSRHSKQVHSEVRAFACEVCGKMFKSKGDVKHHMAVHNKEPNFKCGHCDKKFKSKNILSSHIKYHSTLRPFQCAQCSMRFKTKQELSRHIKSVHSDVRPFSCDICAKSFKSKSDLKRHGLVHSNKYDIKCNVCDAKFKCKTDLVRHIKFVHSKACPFKCNECKKSFKTKQHIKTHMLMHLNLRQFKCKKCGKGFNGKGNLKRHQLLHSKHF